MAGRRVLITGVGSHLGGLLAARLERDPEFEAIVGLDTRRHGPEAAADRGAVLELTERVRETIQEALYANLIRRGRAFG